MVEDFKHGVALVGEESFSPLFGEKFQPASMTVEQLEMTAAMNRSRAMARPLTEHARPHAIKLVELSQTDGSQQGKLQHAVLGARSAEGKWHLYISQSLPFGSIASVCNLY